MRNRWAAQAAAAVALTLEAHLSVWPLQAMAPLALPVVM
jgi:hypothetical protein